MRTLTSLIMLIFLSSCASDAEIAAARYQKDQKELSYAQQLCTSYGLKTSDPYFGICVQTAINNLHQQEQDARNRQVAFWTGVKEAGEALQGSSAADASSSNNGGFRGVGGYGVTCRPTTLGRYQCY